jgi:hypothetical protein
MLKLEPICASFELTNSNSGFFKSFNQLSVIEKIHISEVAPNLFFSVLNILKLSYLSPSKYKTVSTICSRVFGQAKFPSFVMCQMIKTVVFVVLAKVTRISLINFT